MKRCIVTGCAGFVGSSICDRLLSQGHEVIGVDCFLDYYPREDKLKNLQSAMESDRFTLLEQNLLETDLASLLQGSNWIFHQAAQAGVRASWGKYFQTYTDNNILATQRLLEAVKQSSEPIEKLVYASSSSIYGNAESRPTPESTTPAPVSPYGMSKLAAEHLMKLYASEFGVPTVSLRYFTVYGPRQRPDMAFHRLIRTGLLGETFTLFGDGEQSRDFTFIDDIVTANILAAEKGKPGAVFNVGGGSRVTMNQVIEIIQQQVGTLSVERTERQSGDARHTSSDLTLISQELGYKAQVALEQGIEQEVSWMKSHLEL